MSYSICSTLIILFMIPCISTLSSANQGVFRGYNCTLPFKPRHNPPPSPPPQSRPLPSPPRRWLPLLPPPSRRLPAPPHPRTPPPSRRPRTPPSQHLAPPRLSPPPSQHLPPPLSPSLPPPPPPSRRPRTPPLPSPSLSSPPPPSRRQRTPPVPLLSPPPPSLSLPPPSPSLPPPPPSRRPRTSPPPPPPLLSPPPPSRRPRTPPSQQVPPSPSSPLPSPSPTPPQSPRKIIVGGSQNWRIGFNYSDWALKNGPFYQNDILVFKYRSSPPHSVYLVPNLESFNNCDLGKAEMVANSTQGNGDNGFEFVLNKLQQNPNYYFACGEANGFHCKFGSMKFTITPILQA